MKAYLTVFLLLFLSMVARADHDLSKRAFVNTIFENDIFFWDDALYSNGLFINWGYNRADALDEQNLPDWIAYLAQQTYLTSEENKQYTISYGIGQTINTPTILSKEDLIEEDPPYAGLLAWEVSLLSYDEMRSDEMGLILGVVGPIAGGEFVQSSVHKLLGAVEPKGWDNQLDNEPVFRVQARRTWCVYKTDVLNREFDLLTGLDGGVGNFRSDLSTGIGIRFGRQLRQSLSSATVFPVQKFSGLNNSPYGWYLFMNASASYVANDIFIDGNTFKESHHVELIHPQYSFSVGLSSHVGNFSFLYTLLYMSNEFEDQAEDSRFGSIGITYHF